MFFRGHLSKWVGVGLLSAFVNLLVLSPSVHMLLTYDNVLTSGSRPTLYALLALVIGLLACMWVLDVARHALASYAAKLAALDLRRRAFDIDFGSRLSAGAGTRKRVLDDIESSRRFLSGTPFMAFIDAPWVPVDLAVLYALHPYFGLVGTVAVASTLSMAFALDRRTRRPVAEERGSVARERSFREGVLRSAGTAQAHGMRSRLFGRWSQWYAATVLASEGLGARTSFWSTLAKSVRMMYQVLVLSVGAYLVLEGELDPGRMIMGSIVMSRALAPVEQAFGGWRGFSSFRQAHARIARDLAGHAAGDREDATPVRMPADARLEATALCVGPPGADRPFVEGVTLSVAPGETLFVSGHNGSGKSTLLRALAGAWAPMDGHVRLGGVDIHSWESSDRGGHFGYLPQPPELFQGTVAENIARFTGDQEGLTRAIEASGFAAAFNRLPRQLDTEVVDGGANLTPGMAKRVGLAAAIFGDPHLVVLDEPEAGLDEEGIAGLRKIIGDLRERGAIVVVASHSAWLAKMADQAIVLADGKVARYGRPVREGDR